jgi:hypothetical protein
MIPLRILTTTPSVLGISFFLYCSFRGFGCGKGTWFDDFFRRDQEATPLHEPYAKRIPSQKQREELLSALQVA